MLNEEQWLWLDRTDDWTVVGCLGQTVNVCVCAIDMVASPYLESILGGTVKPWGQLYAYVY